MGLMALKGDMSKAYDRLNWNFSRGVLYDLNLPDSLVHLIMATIETDAKSITGIKIGKNGPEISRLLFVDDSLFFIRGAYGEMDFLMNIIDEYCASSGQRINIGKSSIIFSPNCTLMTVKNCLTGYKLAPKHDLGNYLGLPTIWRILSIPGSPIGKVISPKIGTQVDSLVQNCWRTIGSLSRLNAWKSRWIQGDSLQDLCGEFINDPPDPSIMVGELHDIHRRWDLSSLGFDPGEDVKERILATYIPCQSSYDSFYWKFSKHGDYTVKSCYYVDVTAISNRSVSGVDGSRMSPTIISFCKSKLWKLPCTNKLMVFLWKLMANALPMGSEFRKRNLSWRSSCSLCDNLTPCVESISHLFRHCSFAKALWFGCPLGFRLMHEVENEMIFKNSHPWPKRALSSILDDVSCMTERLCSKDSQIGHAYILNMSSKYDVVKSIMNSFPWWLIGGSGCGNGFTMKCDAAWRVDKLSGLGWCLLDGQEKVCFTGSARSFASSALHAEGLAAIMALKWALNAGVLHVRLVTDCLNLVLQVIDAEKGCCVF
ncbi:uncharacterized protein LOC141629127 [Silene latifolia]|uniref:uncharacterized protein LOC141629127 n=1 Tax=Silene latifolia TaxID=37657 RepID=UPI003D774C4C